MAAAIRGKRVAGIKSREEPGCHLFCLDRWGGWNLVTCKFAIKVSTMNKWFPKYGQAVALGVAVMASE